MVCVMNTLILNSTGATRYHNKLTIYELKKYFMPDCEDIAKRELKRLNKELSIYKKYGEKIMMQGISKESKNFCLSVLKEIYMRNDKRFAMRDYLNNLVGLMINPNCGICTEDIIKAKNVSIESMHSFNKLKKTRRGFTACCPFGTHEDKTPSFSVRDNKFICFSCQEKGDAISFIMKLNNVKFMQAVGLILNDK